MDNHIKGRILEVLNRVTGKNLVDINLEGDLRSQLSLDSIMIVELFAALEKELGIELPLQLMTVKTGKAFMEMLEIELKSNVH
jgi:acyl carrier protein